ncbi:Mpv17/PMP22 family protein [Thermosipho globiformans]|uniref:Mpv17/PMP22 family protein n=1 Tax=Thermosipho globiformans TaxID=380685 RepID=UPI000F8D75E6|nr:Mpv17/PMP22 family protein [Thermosipho globiformans]
MKKGDFIWLGLFSLIVFLLVFKPTHQVYITLNRTHPYLMGFLKVSILATMGELLSIRLQQGKYLKPYGLFYRFLVWGFLGMCFVLVFELFASGTDAVMKKGLLPGNNKVLHAFFTSALMNLIFAPTFMAFHRITDTYIDLGKGKITKIFSIKFSNVIDNIDWQKFFGFVILKTIPFFWIPAHTITFLLPPEYRVLTAAMLSIVLGILLSLRKG